MTDRIAVDPEPFEMIPHWLLFSNLSSNALRIWLVLRKHRDYATGMCYPGRKRIAELCGVSLSTVKREIANLAKVGAITVTKRKSSDGDADTNLYCIHWEPHGVIHRGGVTKNPPRFTKNRGVGSQRTTNKDPLNKDVPGWISAMDDGPEHDAVFLAHQKGLL